MATFNEVFSTTWKVLLALILISLGIGFIYMIIGAIGNGSRSSTSSHELSSPGIDYEHADTAPTKMPKSVWDRMVKGNLDAHVPMEGMSKEQIAQILGKPTTSAATSNGMGGETWIYTKVVKKGECQKYEGDNCVQ